MLGIRHAVLVAEQRVSLVTRRTIRADVLDEGSQAPTGSWLVLCGRLPMTGRTHHQVDDAWLSTLASLPPSCFPASSPCVLPSYMYHICRLARGPALTRFAEREKGGVVFGIDTMERWGGRWYDTSAVDIGYLWQQADVGTCSNITRNYIQQ